LLRLKLIPLLRRQGLRLDQIREYFDRHDEAALANRLNEEETVKPLPKMALPTAPLPGSFIHYILPEGMTLLVPAEVAARQPAKVKEIVRTIQEKMEKD
jgi:DNA-binding transcriptional MerR regulator